MPLLLNLYGFSNLIIPPRGRPKKTWSKVIEKNNLSDPTNMQGRCRGPYEMEKINNVALIVTKTGCE